jgi:hypothetical protein
LQGGWHARCCFNVTQPFSDPTMIHYCATVKFNLDVQL